MKGDTHEVSLKPYDIILMNPPFTKVERGIKKFVNMSHFYKVCGGEVGLWGHFISLAQIFLKEKGFLGAVLPINTLRGRESQKVRNILFTEMTPLYIIKATRNYGFSEWAEYRDILFVAKNSKPKKNQKVKFCLIRKELTQLNESDVDLISQNIMSDNYLRTKYLDIDSYEVEEVRQRFNNMMWYCGTTDFRSRDIIVKFVDKFSGKLKAFPDNYFREGYRPVPEGVSKFLFSTRDNNTTRTQQAFLTFKTKGESKTSVNAISPLGVSFKFNQSTLTKTLRTPIGLHTMDITGKEDYIANHPYSSLKKVLGAIGFVQKEGFSWTAFWENLKFDLQRIETQVTVVNRINPFSPSTCILAFYSDNKMSPSNQMNVINEANPAIAKAVCVLLNSSVFLSQFFLTKEESTGRYIHIRFYDLYEMNLYPENLDLVARLGKVYKKYKDIDFPPLSEQFDKNFVQRYQEFWEKESSEYQQKLWTFLDKPVVPDAKRLNFDMDVSKALGVGLKAKDLKALYTVIIKEMIITRHLRRD